MWVSYRKDDNTIWLGPNIPSLSDTFDVQKVANVESPEAPTLCSFGDRIYLAWENGGSIYIGSTDGTKWRDLVNVEVVVEGIAPVLATSSSDIYLTYLSNENPSNEYKPIFYTTSSDGTTFSKPFAVNGQTRIRDCMSDLSPAPIIYWNDVVLVSQPPPGTPPPDRVRFKEIDSPVVASAINPEEWSKPPIGLGSVTSNAFPDQRVFVTDAQQLIWAIYGPDFQNQVQLEYRTLQPPDAVHYLQSAAACSAVLVPILGQEILPSPISIIYRGPRAEKPVLDDQRLRQNFVEITRSWYHMV